MIYKVIRGFIDKKTGEQYKTGTYVEIKNDMLLEIRTRIRRRNLLLARDQKGARKLVGVADSRKHYEKIDNGRPEKKQKTTVKKKEVKNAKIKAK